MKTAHFLKTIITTTQDLSAAVLDYTTVLARAFKLEEVRIKADASITETISVYRVSTSGTQYLLDKATLIADDTGEYVFRPQGECNFRAGDNVRVYCTNANGVGNLEVEISTSEM